MINNLLRNPFARGALVTAATAIVWVPAKLGLNWLVQFLPFPNWATLSELLFIGLVVTFFHTTHWRLATHEAPTIFIGLLTSLVGLMFIGLGFEMSHTYGLWSLQTLLLPFGVAWIIVAFSLPRKRFHRL